VKRKRFSVEQITAVLQQVECGASVGDVCRQRGDFRADVLSLERSQRRHPEPSGIRPASGDNGRRLAFASGPRIHSPSIVEDPSLLQRRWGYLPPAYKKVNPTITLS
jgi:hypothetical protein